MLKAVLTSLDRWLDRPQALRTAWASHCSTVGRSVLVRLGTTELVGTAVAVNDDGSLTVVDESGHRHTVRSGDVVHRSDEG